MMQEVKQRFELRNSHYSQNTHNFLLKICYARLASLRNVLLIMEFRNSKTNKGFTLLETVVAVAVLMTAIVGPLTLAAQSIRAQGYTRNNVTASMLVQEGLELVRWYRDNNVKQSGNIAWLNGMAACVSGSCGIDVKNYVSQPNLPDCAMANSCKLDFDMWTGTYYHCLTGCAPTIFNRTITIQPISPPTSVVDGTPDEVKVTVTVSWIDQFGPRTFAVTTHLFNW